MLENRVKRVMREGGFALIGYVGAFPGPIAVELAGYAGFDGIRVDLEHTPLGLDDIHIKVLAAERMGITPLVRPPSLDPAFILRLLDMGVQGITLPHISNPRAAKEAVDAVRFPPIGHRGMGGGTRAAHFGSISRKEHIVQSNREILLGVLIEDAEGIDEIDAIAGTEGIDMVAIGVNDLALGLGVTGTVDDPKLVDAVNRIAEAVRRHKKFLSISIGHKVFPRTLPELRKLGVCYAHCGPSPEARLLESMSAQVAEFRKLING
jgi:4-hydroxy-2-oxoheptanedioate aldolase